MRLASSSSSTGSAYSTPLRATGWPSSKRTVTSSALICTLSCQKATPMMGCTIRMPALRSSRSLASWVAPSMLESVE
ncbi:Uncharacterised protein [Bordetella pertussis]|nr:Uncharacterised protein [Bordetella pertussis]CPM41807.1 Uncharacterised protein [Bordetella pertussis]